MVIQDVPFLPSSPSSTPHKKKIMVEVEAPVMPHVLKLWLGISEDMLPVKYLSSKKSSFVSVKFHGGHKTIIKLRLTWPPSVFWDITGLKTVVSV